ncbi:MAG: hypothetical protein AAF802_14795 [Planctomycetota bacterium]
MIFEREKTYDHDYVMKKLEFTSVASFQKWIKKHEIKHFRTNGIWTFDGNALVDFFRLASKTASDWKQDQTETRMHLED